MKYETFKSFALKASENTYGQFYNSYEEFVDHFTSGEVKISFKDMLDLQTAFELQKPVKNDRALRIKEIETELLYTIIDDFHKLLN